jgi:hypothetical protein
MISLHDGRGPGPNKASGTRVYALRLTVGSIRTRIWRRLLVRENMWLSRLHEAIQHSFGWYDYQTHVFSAGERQYGNPLHRDGVMIEDDRDASLAAVLLLGRGRLAYDYLFADGWHVDIRVEKIARAEKNGKYPRCVAGERAGPPEDCGGVDGYQDMVCCLKHPETDLGREWRKWLGDKYDPEKCDLDAINKALKQLAK